MWRPDSVPRFSSCLEVLEEQRPISCLETLARIFLCHQVFGIKLRFGQGKAWLWYISVCSCMQGRGAAAPRTTHEKIRFFSYWAAFSIPYVFSGQWEWRGINKQAKLSREHRRISELLNPPAEGKLFRVFLAWSQLRNSKPREKHNCFDLAKWTEEHTPATGPPWREVAVQRVSLFSVFPPESACCKRRTCTRTRMHSHTHTCT